MESSCEHNDLTQKIHALEKENEILKERLVILTKSLKEFNTAKNEYSLFSTTTEYEIPESSDKEERQLYKLLIENEKRFKAFTTITKEGILIHEKGIIKDANPAALEIFKGNASQLIGRNILDIVTPEYYQLVKSKQFAGSTGNYEIVAIRHDGTTLPVEVNAREVKIEDKIYRVVTVNDITEKKKNEARLMKTLEFNEKINQTSPVGITLINKEGAITFANKKAEETLGLCKKDIEKLEYNSREWKIQDFYGEAFPAERLPFNIVKKKKKSVYNMRHAIEWPNGKRVFLSINASPQLDEKGNFQGMIATIEDITEKVMAERQLNETLVFKNAVIKNAAEGLCVCRTCTEYPYLHFTIWNDKMTKITGYRMKEINKLGWYQSLYPNPVIRKKAMNRITGITEGKDIIGEEWTIKTKSGKNKVLSISASIIKTEKSRADIIFLITNVTEKEKYRKTIERKNRELKELNATKDKFFSILAHDLKGPVAQLLNISGLLAEEHQQMDTEKRDVFIRSLNASTVKLSELIEDLLTWSRAQMDTYSIEPQEIDIKEVIDEILELFSTNITKKHLNIKIILNNSKKIFADLFSVKTILRNLLSNAIKFSYKGGIIEIVTDNNKDSEVKVSVKDYGTGMTDDIINGLFNIEKTVSKEGTENEKGTGLGLIICKELIEKNNGVLLVQSNIKSGSNFSFKLQAVD
jgi:PAS domain S-box-containing protein